MIELANAGQARRMIRLLMQGRHLLRDAFIAHQAKGTPSVTEKRPTHHHASSRTTGNDPVEGASPGGTHAPSANQGDKRDSSEKHVDHAVKSGDRNVWRESRSPQPGHGKE